MSNQTTPALSIEPGHTATYRGCTIAIDHDEDAENPLRFDGSVGTIAAYHARYNLGHHADQTLFDIEQADGFDALVDHLRDTVGATVVLRLGMHDHSGLSLWLSDDPITGDWDSGRLGFVYDTADARDRTGITTEQVRDALDDQIDTHNQYLAGDVYEYTVTGLDGDHITSCGGYYDLDDAIAEATEEVDAHMDQHDKDVAATVTALAATLDYNGVAWERDSDLDAVYMSADGTFGTGTEWLVKVHTSGSLHAIEYVDGDPTGTTLDAPNAGRLLDTLFQPAPATPLPLDMLRPGSITAVVGVAGIGKTSVLSATIDAATAAGKTITEMNANDATDVDLDLGGCDLLVIDDAQFDDATMHTFKQRLLDTPDAPAVLIAVQATSPGMPADTPVAVETAIDAIFEVARVNAQIVTKPLKTRHDANRPPLTMTDVVDPTDEIAASGNGTARTTGSTPTIVEVAVPAVWLGLLSAGWEFVEEVDGINDLIARPVRVGHPTNNNDPNCYFNDTREVTVHADGVDVTVSVLSDNDRHWAVASARWADGTRGSIFSDDDGSLANVNGVIHAGVNGVIGVPDGRTVEVRIRLDWTPNQRAIAIDAVKRIEQCGKQTAATLVDSTAVSGSVEACSALDRWSLDGLLGSIAIGRMSAEAVALCVGAVSQMEGLLRAPRMKPGHRYGAVAIVDINGHVSVTDGTVIAEVDASDWSRMTAFTDDGPVHSIDTGMSVNGLPSPVKMAKKIVAARLA